MIRTFCDCCGEEIPSNIIENNNIRFPVRRVHINKNEYISEDFLIELMITAKIYEPENLLDEVKEDRLCGYIMCKDCIIESLTQKER
jgi:hypothetical protein